MKKIKHLPVVAEREIRKTREGDAEQDYEERDDIEDIKTSAAKNPLTSLTTRIHPIAPSSLT
ncbi:MAG: hypothetical protein ACE5DR_05850 [Thermodesulfobacteriota bacterium]